MRHGETLGLSKPGWRTARGVMYSDEEGLITLFLLSSHPAELYEFLRSLLSEAISALPLER